MSTTTVYVPTDFSIKAVASVLGYVTDGLDVIVSIHEKSETYEGHIRLVLDGNPQDTQIAAERAASIGGFGD